MNQLNTEREALQECVTALEWFAPKSPAYANAIAVLSRSQQPATAPANALVEAMVSDPEFAWIWHCNIAMAFVDEGGDHALANHAAARFLRMFAGVEPAHELPVKQPATAVPAGWKLVPIEPTDAMSKAGFSRVDYGTTVETDIDKAWADMLDAAPPSPPAQAASPSTAFLSWCGFNVTGDPASINAVKLALHDAGTVSSLKSRIREDAERLAALSVQQAASPGLTDEQIHAAWLIGSRHARDAELFNSGEEWRSKGAYVIETVQSLAAPTVAQAGVVDEQMRRALHDAATSLETIGRLAGRAAYLGDDGERIPTYMEHFDEVRGYANSRASAARAALTAPSGQEAAPAGSNT